MPEDQKTLQKEWYNRGKASCSLALMDLNNEAHLERLRALLPDGAWQGKALEVGCGSGWYSEKLRPLFGIDISLNSLASRPGKGTVRIVADAENLPFKSGSFDLLYGFAILHHLENIEKCLEEARRILKEGGQIAFGSENNALCPMNYLFPLLYRNWHVEKGFTRISKRNLSSLLEKTGFTSPKFDFGGFAVYGLSPSIYRWTKRMENLLSRIPFLKRFSGFIYFFASKL